MIDEILPTNKMVSVQQLLSVCLSVGTLRFFDGDGKDDWKKCVFILLWNLAFIWNYPLCPEYATNAFISK